MTDYFDDLEIQSAQAREARQLAALRDQIRHAKTNAPYFSRILAHVDPENFTATADLAGLPVLRKSDLIALQAEDPPFGGMVAEGAGAIGRMFLSPGPIADPEGVGADWWRLARALHAGGIRAGHIILNCFSYHLTPAGHMLDSAARALGCTVIPGGVGNSEDQVRAASFFGANAYVGTPDFLRILLDKADEMGLSLGRIDHGLVAGGPLFPDMRDHYRERGIGVLQCYAIADLGLVAYESAAPGGGPVPGMMVDENVIVEIVRPGSGDPVPDGEVGEVVVTQLANREYPLIRLATGDLSAILSGVSPCGRTGRRIKGWMGRADQTTKVGGLFVRPEQIAQIVARHPEAGKARLVVTTDDRSLDVMTLRVECDGALDEAALAESVNAITRLRAAIETVEPGALPNDGIVIEDARDHS